MGVTEEQYKILLKLPMFQEFTRVKLPETLSKLQRDVLNFVGRWMPILPAKFEKPKENPDDENEEVKYFKASYISLTRYYKYFSPLY